MIKGHLGGELVASSLRRRLMKTLGGRLSITLGPAESRAVAAVSASVNVI